MMERFLTNFISGIMIFCEYRFFCICFAHVTQQKTNYQNWWHWSDRAFFVRHVTISIDFDQNRGIKLRAHTSTREREKRFNIWIDAHKLNFRIDESIISAVWSSNNLLHHTAWAWSISCRTTRFMQTTLAYVIQETNQYEFSLNDQSDFASERTRTLLSLSRNRNLTRIVWGTRSMECFIFSPVLFRGMGSTSQTNGFKS